MTEYLDEELAKKMRKMREEKAALENTVDEEEEWAIRVDRVKEGIQAGQVNIEKRNLFFKKYEILDKKIEMYIPTNDIEIMTDDPLIFQAMDNTSNISIIVSCNNENMELSALEQRKQQIDNSVKSMELRCRWKKAETLLVEDKEVQYFEYVMLTGLVVIYNVMWVYLSEEGLMTYLFNFEEKEEKIWLPIIQAVRELGWKEQVSGDE
ncbi:hypothetical protein [Anaerosporobacter sp.]|uniref:hypothetical protein n=1 Tax=Anaerosporobacter sp. TaxID=1872529 RepID=UPI00286F1C63|nr:hypothetical protein [Anaerosporobacter sp.]